MKTRFKKGAKIFDIEVHKENRPLFYVVNQIIGSFFSIV